MINSKLLQKASLTNGAKSRSRSIYRGNKSHTASMHIRVDCDMSPETVRRPPEEHSACKPGFKENKTQLMRESLRMVEPSSGKKTQREELGEKQSRTIMLQTRHLQTERALKETTNLLSRKESSGKQEKTSMASIKLSSKGDRQEVAMSEEELRGLLLAMRDLEKENRRLRKELTLFFQQPRSTVARAF